MAAEVAAAAVEAAAVVAAASAVVVAAVVPPWAGCWGALGLHAAMLSTISNARTNGSSSRRSSGAFWDIKVSVLFRYCEDCYIKKDQFYCICFLFICLLFIGTV